MLRTEDEDVELWYMLALSQGLGGDVAAASECLQRAMTVSITVCRSTAAVDSCNCCLRFGVFQLLDKNADSDSTGQLRGQVLAAVQEIEALGPAPSADATPMQSE